MLYLLLLVALLTFVALGYGTLFSKRVNILSLVLGYLCLLLLTNLYHFLLPITRLTSALILLPGLALAVPLLTGLAKLIRGYRSAFIRQSFKKRMLITTSFLLTSTSTFLMALAASFPIDWYDSFLYHIPVSIWNSYNHIIPGLALLDGRLAVTSGQFLLTSLIHLFPPLNGQYQVIPLMFSIWLLWFSFGCFISYTNKQSTTDLFGFLLLPFFLAFHASWLFSSTAPEAGLVVFTSLCIWGALKKDHVLMISALLAGFSQKPSVVLLIITACVVLILHYKKLTIPPIRITVLLLLFFITWSVRTNILSGYFLFPSTLTYFPMIVKSAVPRAEAVKFSIKIYEWARYNPYTVRIDDESEWLITGFIPTLPYAYTLGLFFGLLAIILFVARNTWRTAILPISIYISLFITLFIGYRTAPDSRLLLHILIPMASLGFALLISEISSIRIHIATLIKNVLLIFIFITLMVGIKSTVFPSRPLLRARMLFIPQPTIFSANPDSKVLHEGILVTYPNENDDRCGVAPAPCITYIDKLNLLHFLVKNGKINSVSRR